MKHALALLVIAGCSTSSSGPSDDDPDPSAENPQPTAAGPYRIVNQIDLTAEAILPEQAELIVSTLRAFSTNPARTLVEAADEAGVPAVGELYSVLPSLITDHLDGWINDEIARVQINGMPVTEYTARIAAVADTALTHFAIDSELALHAGAASHRLTALDLTPTGLPIALPIGGLAGDLLTQDTTATVGARGALSVGEQHFGLNYGEYAWQGVEAASRITYGGDVRDLLGRAISCPDLAHDVASKCVLGTCVGHEAELLSICEGGLDAIVDLTHDRMAEIRLEALHLASGQATLVDDDHDGIADRITAGAWQAELDLGLGPRHAPATFTGTR